MHLTRRQAVDTLLRYVGELGDGETRILAQDVLAEALDAIWLAHLWLDYQSPRTLLITLVPGQSRYSLPDLFHRFATADVRNLSRNGQRLVSLADRDEARRYPTTDTPDTPSGSPEAYRLVGTTGVGTQPQSAGQALEVLSSDAADTDVVVSIEGDQATGHARTSVTLTGTAPVALGTWGYLDTFAKAIAGTLTAPGPGLSSRGTVSLRVVGGDVLQALTPDTSHVECQVVQFYPVPAAPDLISLPFLRRPRRLLSDADPVPVDWWPAVREEWLIQWRVNTGELNAEVAGAAPRPALRKLIEDDNLRRPRPQRRPATAIGGGWR